MFSAKDEKNSLGATLWFNVAHYALRPWPWIVTALVAIAVYSPNGGIHPSAAFGQNPEQGYVMVLRDYLPPALRGLMVAAFLAAFMSTVGTQLNWGCSYLVNDLYKRFMVRDKPERHYVMMSRVFTVLLVLVSGYTASQLSSIGAGWGLVLEVGFGTGAVAWLVYGLVGFLVGIVCGKAIWRQDTLVTPLLKGIFGFLVGLGLFWVAGKTLGGLHLALADAAFQIAFTGHHGSSHSRATAAHAPGALPERFDDLSRRGERSPLPSRGDQAWADREKVTRNGPRLCGSKMALAASVVNACLRAGARTTCRTMRRTA